MSNFGYKLSRITSYLQTGKIRECEAMEQIRKIVSKELSDDELWYEKLRSHIDMSAVLEDRLPCADNITGLTITIPKATYAKTRLNFEVLLKFAEEVTGIKKADITTASLSVYTFEKMIKDTGVESVDGVYISRGSEEELSDE